MTTGREDREPGDAADANPDHGAADDADLPDKLFFRIGESAQLIGVEPHVLRYWESEFGMAPQRSASGQRMYRRGDIARFVRIRRLLHEEGFTIAGARKALEDPSGAEEAGSQVDASRVGRALERLREARGRVAALRARIGVGEGSDGGDE
jgi:DNA-binding transcriptional MerR regulator